MIPMRSRMNPRPHRGQRTNQRRPPARRHTTPTTGSGALREVPYSFLMRFGDDPGTNPEELVAAAHAGCFSMALSGELERAGYRAESIRTKATPRVEKTDAGFT